MAGMMGRRQKKMNLDIVRENGYLQKTLDGRRGSKDAEGKTAFTGR